MCLIIENGDDDQNGENREADQDAIAKMIQQIVEKVPGVVPVTELEPTALFMYGKVLPVTRKFLSIILCVNLYCSMMYLKNNISLH